MKSKKLVCIFMFFLLMSAPTACTKGMNGAAPASVREEDPGSIGQPGIVSGGINAAAYSEDGQAEAGYDSDRPDINAEGMQAEDEIGTLQHVPDSAGTVGTLQHVPDNAGTVGEIILPDGTSIIAPRLIAHAGGDIYGIRMTNSRQALNKSYEEGFRFIEVDMCETSDGITVLIHDWGNANWFSGVRYSAEQPAYKDFCERDGILGLEFMNIGMLSEWMTEHKDAYIITDIKDDNITILKDIIENYPEAGKRFIPQIYSLDEYKSVSELGYDQIILTLYRINDVGDEVYEFCAGHPLFALTISQERAVPEQLDKFRSIGIPVYVHTVNDYNVYIKLRDNGAYGVYTDFFQPCDWIE